MKAPLDDYDRHVSIITATPPPPPTAERPFGIFPPPPPVQRSTGIPLRPPAGSNGVNDRTLPATLDEMKRKAGG
jgi:hypothetical protein